MADRLRRQGGGSMMTKYKKKSFSIKSTKGRVEDYPFEIKMKWENAF